MTKDYLLRSFEAYNNLYQVSFNKETMEVLLSPNLESKEKKQVGIFYEGKENPTGFFLAHNSWYFFVGASVFNVGDIEAIHRKYVGAGHADLEVSLRSGQLVKIDYCIGGKIEGDPTPFVEDEDFDYGVFFENVVLNEERLRRINDIWESM